jgi:hypothetical protein
MQNVSGVSGVILGSTMSGLVCNHQQRPPPHHLLTNDHQLIVASLQQRQQQQQQQRQRQREWEIHMTTATTTTENDNPTTPPQAVTSESSLASMSTAMTFVNGSNAVFSSLDHQSQATTHIATAMCAAPPPPSPSLMAMAVALPLNPTSIGGGMMLIQQQQQQQSQLQQQLQLQQLQVRRPVPTLQQPLVAVATTAGNDPSSTLLAVPTVIPGMMAGAAGGGYDAPLSGMGGVGMGGSTVPEFLYQLTKMLTDRSNRDIIEWSTGHVTRGGGGGGGPSNGSRGNNGRGNRIDGADVGGRIEVHHPARLEKEVLSRYFRHSKYSSFQRQLNYFGFRKVAGKGKMSPCSYVNDLISTCDVRSILTMTRKKGAKEQQRATLAGGGSLDGQDGDDVLVVLQDRNNNDDAYGTNDKNDNGRKRRLDEMGNRDDPWMEGMGCNASNAFEDMAVSVARNIVQGSAAMTTMVSSNGMVSTTNDAVPNRVALPPTLGGNAIDASNTTRPISSSSLSSMTTVSASIVGGGGGGGGGGGTACERGYNVAIGKGVRHQLNGYLRPRFVDPTIATATTAIPVPVTVRPTSDDVRVMAGSTTTTTTVPSLVSSLRRPRGDRRANDMSYLSHPAARIASSAPAPLFQFLDPNELGMSPKDIEDSLSQLKDNFALAAATSSGATIATDSKDLARHGLDIGAHASSVVTASDVSSRSSSLSSASSMTGSDQGGGSNDGVFPSSLVRGAATAQGGMLRPNDSLIDLAMLPVLENPVSCGDGNEDADTAGSNDYMATVFSRDDSISNFIAAGYGNGVGCDINATTLITSTASRTSGDDVGLGWSTGMGIGGDGNANTYGFINFQS